MYRGSTADFLVVLCTPGNPTTNDTEGDYTHYLNILLRLSSMYKVFLFGRCSSRDLGGLLRKNAVSGRCQAQERRTCCCSYCCSRNTETETRLGPPKHYHRKYIATREISPCPGKKSAVFTMCYANAHAAIGQSTCTELPRGPWVTRGV